MTADEIAARRWKVIETDQGWDIEATADDEDTLDPSALGVFWVQRHARLAATAPRLFAALRDLQALFPDRVTHGEIGRAFAAADAALAEAVREDTGGPRS